MNTREFVLRRRLARRLDLRDRPFHEVRVPGGPDGRPGETVVAPSRPTYVGVLAPDGSRNDLRVLLSPWSTLSAVCLGTVADRGEPHASTVRTLSRLSELYGATVIEEPTAVTFAGAPAVRSTTVLRSGVTVREVKVEREGWLFVAGLSLAAREPAAVEALGWAVLGTWSWLPGTVDSTNPPYVPRREITIHSSVVVRGSRDAVWVLLRRPEHVGLLVAGVERARRVPGSPDGVGEQHAVTLRRGARKVTVVDEITHDVAGERLSLRRLSPGFGASEHWLLSAHPLGVQVDLSQTLPLATGADPGRVRRTVGREASELLDRLRRVVEGGWTPASR